MFYSTNQSHHWKKKKHGEKNKEKIVRKKKVRGEKHGKHSTGKSTEKSTGKN
jgi:hypothetical protein